MVIIFDCLYNSGVACNRKRFSGAGDLAPLAHMSAVLLGEGEVFYQGERMAAKHGLALAGSPLSTERGLSTVKRYPSVYRICFTGVVLHRKCFDLGDCHWQLVSRGSIGLSRAF